MDYQKAFERVKHDKLAEIMEKVGVPELEGAKSQIYTGDSVEQLDGMERLTGK